MPEKLYAQNVQMIVSDTDPYINAEEAKMMSKHYNIPLTVIKNAGHINADSGYGKWDLIENLVLDRS
jgi:hypothetical protein